MTSEPKATPARPVLTPKKYKENYGEFIGVGPNGNLWVEDCDVADLAAEFGTPLFIISENQFRYTYRQFRDAFRKHYPADSEILFANKSNNGLAYRHIMNQEGAGGDCFGVNEMYLALLAGTDATTLVLNGSNKQDDELEMAVANGLCINIDAMDELDRIDAVCKRLGLDADIGIRLKLDLDPLAERTGVAMHGPGTLKEQSDSTKWGMTREQTVEIVKQALDMPHMDAAVHRHRRRLDVRQVVRHRAALADRRRFGADRRRLRAAVQPGDPGRSDQARPAAAEAAARTRPLTLRPVGRHGRHRRRGQAGREEEVGQSRPFDESPVVVGGARLVLPSAACRRRKGETNRNRRYRRAVVQFGRTRAARGNAAAATR